MFVVRMCATPQATLDVLGVFVPTDPLQLDLPSKGAGGVKARETSQGPHWKHIPVGGVAYGTAFVKYPRNILL